MPLFTLGKKGAKDIKTKSNAPRPALDSAAAAAAAAASTSTTTKHSHAPQYSSSVWGSSSASGSTVEDSSSGFAGSESPGSPAEVAARHAARTAAGGQSYSAGGGGSGGGCGSSSDGGQPHRQQHQQQKEREQEQGWQWGRIAKLKLHSGRAAPSDTQSEAERKRKAEGPARGGGTAAAAVAATMPTHFPSRSGMHSMGNLSPPRLVDNRFQVFDTLGTGYSGKVKRAFNCQTREMVALKVMDTLDPNDPTSYKRFIRLQDEISAMRKCQNHAHIVSLKEHRFNVSYPKRDGQLAVAHMLVMELCERGELYDLLYRGGALPPNVCKEYLRQLMSGIKHCHDLGVCHRDLKPENLLLDANFNLKIADFGFAASNREDMVCCSIVGSKTHMAPEVMDCKLFHPCSYRGVYNGYKADVWSVGIIFFTMLAGHPPMEIAMERDWWFRALKYRLPHRFWQSHENAARQKRTTSEPIFPEDAKDLVTAMLAVDPSHRINVDQIMQHDYLSVWPSDPNPRAELHAEMQARYDASRASKRHCTVVSSDRVTADSAGAENSGTPASATSAASSATAAAGAAVPNPHHRSTWRSLGDNGLVIPVMTEEEAAAVTGGFMASATVRDLVKALEKALDAMGAKIKERAPNGGRYLRETFQVSAVINEGAPTDTVVSDPVGIVAKVYRVIATPATPTDGNQNAAAEAILDQEGGGSVFAAALASDAATPDKLAVVLRRQHGDYYRYRQVEDALVSRMTTHPADVVSMSPTP